MLEIDFLGGFRLAVDGVTLDRPVRQRLQTLLALLVLNAGRALGREQIAELLWPEGTADQGLGGLRRLLFDLRHDLPEAAALVQSSRSSLQWVQSSAWRSDVHDLAHVADGPPALAGVRRAIELYRGPLLPSSYDDWIEVERDSLRSMFLRLLEQGSALAEKDGDLVTATAFTRRLLNEEPLREDIYRRLMDLHVAAGDTAAALSVYHLCATTLDSELGVEPSPPTRELHESLLRARAPSPPIPAASRLVGRSVELRQIEDAWTLAAAGRTQAVILSGEPGMGKTRLLEEMRSWAGRRAIRTLYTRGYDSGPGLPLAPVVALLRAAPLPPLGPGRTAELARLLPELEPDGTARPDDIAGREPWRRTRLFDAINHAVLSAGPLLLLLDDLQWFDGDTLDWLAYLLTATAPHPLLVAGATRPEGPAARGPVRDLWANLVAEGRLSEIELKPLDLDAAAALAANLGKALGPDGLKQLWRESAGNPLVIVETIRAGGRAPESVAQVMAARIAEVSAAARDLAQAAAVIGRAFRLPLLRAVSTLDDGEFIPALDELWRRRIFRQRGVATYDFAHDRLRDAALESTGPAVRQALHGRVAEALERLNQGSLDSVSARIAGHLEAGGDPAGAARYHTRAGWAATRVFAFGEALRHFRRAAQLGENDEDLDVLVGLAEMLYLAGDLVEAEAVYRRAVATAAARGERAHEARLCYGLGVLLQARGHMEESASLLERSTEMFVGLRDERGQVKAMCHLASAHVRMGRAPEALQLIDRAASLALRCGDLRLILFTTSLAGYYASERGDYATAESHHRRALKLAAEEGNPQARATTMQNLGLIALQTERYRVGVEHLSAAVEAHAALDDRVNVALDILNLGQVYARAGNVPQARRCLAVSAHMSMSLSLSTCGALALAGLARASLYGGDAVSAERQARSAVDRLRSVSFARLRFDCILILAEILAERGDVPGLAECAAEVQLLAGQMGRPDCARQARVLSLRAQAMTDAIDSDQVAGEVRQMLASESDDAIRARLHDLLGDLGFQEHRDAAVDLYRALYLNRGTTEYRRRYEALTGQSLPALEPLPPIPEVVHGYPVATEPILAQLDALPAEHVAS